MASPHHPRYRLLDPLRGVAICAVMITHFTTVGGPSSTFFHAVAPVTRHWGYLGVALFFLVSGYCIAGAADRARESVRPAFLFFRHRCRRIFPPYWWSIGLAVGLAAGTIIIGGKTWISIFPLDVRGWLLNLILLQGPFSVGDIQTVYWALTIELQFYLVVAGLLLVSSRTEWAVVGLTFVTAILRAMPSVQLDGTFCAYWGQFSAGMACFYWIYNQGKGRQAALLILLATGLTSLVAAISNPEPFEWSGSLSRPLVDGLAVVGAIILIAVHGMDEKLCRLRVLAALSWLGMISYSLYLTHIFIGGRVLNVGMRLTELRGLWWLFFSLAAVPASIAVGVVFFRYCEKPWMGSFARKRGPQ